MTKFCRRSGVLSAFLVVTSCGVALTATPLDVKQYAGGSSPAPKGGPIDLGTLGGTYSQANAINLLGVVAGVANITGDTAGHAFITGGSTGLIDLGTLVGGINSSAAAVNVLGQVAGTSDYNDPVNGLVQHAFLYTASTIQDLGTLGGTSSQGNGIDAEAIVVGSSLLADEATTHAFWYNPAKQQMKDLGALPNGANSAAFGVNLFGQIAGSSDTGNFDSSGNPITDAVIWDLLKGKIKDLGTLGGSYAQATAINNRGVAVGFSSTATGVTHSFILNCGKLADLGTLGGSYSQANAINDRGVVAGFSNITGDTDVHAFVWSPVRGLVDLNTLLPPNSGWELSAAYGINLEGTVVGVGIINGQSHAFAFFSGL